MSVQSPERDQQEGHGPDPQQHEKVSSMTNQAPARVQDTRDEIRLIAALMVETGR